MTDMSNWLSKQIEGYLRSLLEQKHLYQSVHVDRGAIQTAAVAEFSAVQSKAVDEALDASWHPHDEISSQRPNYIERFARPRSDMPLPLRISFFLPAIKTTCSECREVTPFNLRYALDVYGQRDSNWAPVKAEQGNQEFVFAFECQSCRTPPEVFLVRRRKLRLTLCGRSPMEYVSVPKFIPKEVQKYYSGALVAFQAGQTLAALFLLRLVIEQFTRKATEAIGTLKADEALNRYMESLPKDFNDRFPSLKEIYGCLSVAIHQADESAEIFTGSLDKMNRHFDARRVFQLE